MNPTKNLIEPKLHINPTQNLIETKLYMNPTKNLIELKFDMNPVTDMEGNIRIYRRLYYSINKWVFS
jgi:hypothetical protein